MADETDRPHLPPPHPAVAPGFSMPKQPAEHPRVDADGILERSTWWGRLKARFAREPR